MHAGGYIGLWLVGSGRLAGLPYWQIVGIGVVVGLLLIFLRTNLYPDMYARHAFDWINLFVAGRCKFNPIQFLFRHDSETAFR